MSALIRYADVSVGDEIPARDYQIRRVDLIRYAGASGDFNIIHWNERVAREVGLPGVVAHGMLTMAEAGRAVTDWVGDPGAIREFSVKFTRLVPVPDDEAGATLAVSGKVTELSEGNLARIALTATCLGEKVLGMAYAVVRLG